MKKVKTIILAVCMMLALMLPMSIQAETVTYSGTNVNSQNYSTYYASTVKSYLAECEDGTLMRVQYVSNKSCVVVEYYDADYQLLSTKELPQELSIFGGFYAMNDYYFLLTGQMNEEESDAVEVYRITKYDKEWNRIGSVGLYGANTYIPFDAGSARMDACGKYLLIRTCHEMYMSSDGYHHQANVTIQVDTDAMTVTDSFVGVMNVNYGYVSHSFNQFIKVEDRKIVAIDHGDAYPRSIVLCKYPTDVTLGSFQSSRVTKVDVMNFPGAIGANATGASVGGFEISDSSYLVAGNSVVQDENNTSYRTRNVFVAAVDKTTNEVTTNWLTSFAEGETTTRTPQLVKLSDNEFMILWTRGNHAYYVTCDGRGQKTSEIYCMANAAISDCVPIVKDGKVIWYTWSNETVSFYEISLDNMIYPTGIINKNGVQTTKTFCGDMKHDIVKVEYQEPGCYEDGHHAHWGCSVCGSTFKDAEGKEEYDLTQIIIPAVHKYEVAETVGSVAHLVCSACGDEVEKIAPTRMTIYWNYTNGSGYYYSSFDSEVNIGDKVYYWNQPSPSNFEGAINIIVSDPDAVKYVKSNATMGYFEILKPGNVDVTIVPEYNPQLTRTYTFEILCGDIHNWSETYSYNEDYHWYECSVCGEHKEEAEHFGGTATATAKARCEGCGAEYGDYAEPTVVQIVAQPSDASAKIGENAVVTVEAIGDGLTYTWYYKAPGAKAFQVSAPQFVNGNTYTIAMYKYRDGQQVYCVIEDGYGNTITSNEVTLTMAKGTIEIVQQPNDAMVKQAGEDGVVTVEALGEGLTYTWYYKNPGNVKFYKSGLGETGNSYTIPVTQSRNGQQVYCIITDANGFSIQTNTVTLSIAKADIVLTKDIASVEVVTAGDAASLTVEAQGEGLTYTWYYKNPGNMKFYASGPDFVSEDGTTYTIPVFAWRNGQQVYCVITDAQGFSVQSATATLSIAK